MKQLFPAIQPNQTWSLQRDSHQIYLEESGNPGGIPVLFLHGGPGTGCIAAHRRFFNPEIYRIILFDQRGCGRSTPHCSLIDNTTWHLVGDIEAIRVFLQIDKFLLFGGSWGSSLSLAYAQSYPESVSALILRGIFLCREAEIQWFYQSGTNKIFPDYWTDFIAPVNEKKHNDIVSAYSDLLSSTNELKQMAAARAWVTWENRCSVLTHTATTDEKGPPSQNMLAMARIENHYFINQSFLSPNQLLENMDKISSIPSIIVHGRYDAICPLENALQLHRAWHASCLNIIPATGHSAFEVGNIDALINATEYFSSLPGLQH
ncbi:MAG: prolyl aminopeptidase [Gammaproteobacteria bacterium]|nr:prolyl aminopeptidase [Gammaproteobacteria bacterium]